MARKFGTFLGVYIPSILTILGLIMYLRFGWVLGNVGLPLTLLIVLLASSITFITALSASSIATNIEVGVGGEYFIVSRSMGIETGGAIGIPLYFCRTLSVTFYCFGLSEAIVTFWPLAWGELPEGIIQWMAAAFIILITLLSGRSASLTLKLQIPIFILVCLSIFALIFGVLSAEKQAPILEPSYTTAEGGFWYVFAVFFPAVTGFTAGIGMSGDLVSPRRSIPRGTLAAVISGAIIYMLIPVVLSITALLTIEQLTDLNYGLKSWTNVALLGGILVIPAVWGALLSSAFGSILGGPRVLQALSMDGLAPPQLSRLSKTGEPTIATWVTGSFALLAVLLGDLNTIAQFVSVLFLSLYVTINASAAVEDFVNEPSYRPTLRVPWFVSIIGVFGAIGVMFLISPGACLFAVILIGTIYYWLKSRSLEQKWGDVAVGFWTNVTRYGLAKLENQKFFGRNWRPFILTFVKDIDKRLELIKLVSLLGQNHGILTIAYLEEAKSVLPIEEKMNKQKRMSERLAKYGFNAFCEVYPAETFNQGVREVTKAHGIAKLKTNTVAFGLSDGPDDLLEQVHCLRQLAELGKNLLVFDCKTLLPKEGQMVDIWWGGRENNGDLMLILAYLLKINLSWSNARIRILSLVRDEQSQRKLELGIRELLPSIRIRAEVIVIVSNEELYSVLKDSSSNSDLVFLGIPKIEEGNEKAITSNIIKLSSALNNVLFVQNNGMSSNMPILLKL